MAHHSYEKAKKLVFRGMWLLAIVTLLEVFISLLQKGHIISGVEDISAIVIIAAILIGALSIYKAYYIIYNFMHMAHEVPGLRMSVLLPTALLIWAIIAFFQEGNSWGESRDKIQEKNKIEAEDSIKPQGMLLKEKRIKYLH